MCLVLYHGDLWNIANVGSSGVQRVCHATEVDVDFVREGCSCNSAIKLERGAERCISAALLE